MPSERPGHREQQDSPEKRLREVWIETRDDLDYDDLVDMHWDICREIVERDGGQDG